MADAQLSFVDSGKLLASTKGWRSFSDAVGGSFLKEACDSRSVYIIRMERPFAIAYPYGQSPVTYIGRGDFKRRITNHLKVWLNPLSKNLVGAKFRVAVSRPRAKKNINFYKDVEADLIQMFEEKYGRLPLRNARRESHSRSHTYDPKVVAKVLGLGRGKGYYWALWPVGSNVLVPRADK